MSENVEIMRCTLKLKSVPVIFETEEGTEKKGTIKELTGKLRDQYLTSMSGKMKYDDKGRPSGIKTFDGLQAGLLALCLYDEDNELIPIADIQKFPSTTQDDLYKKAQELSALNIKGEEEAKNS